MRKKFFNTFAALCGTVALALSAGCASDSATSKTADLSTFASLVPATGELASSFTLNRIYGSGMVLQRDEPIPIVGSAEPGKTLKLTLGTQTVTVWVDEAGRFTALFDALPASTGPLRLTVHGKNDTLVLDDILIGDVWLGSGQSNMVWRVRQSTNAAAEIAAADYPQIRFFNVSAKPSIGVVADDIAGGEWQVVSPQTVGNASGVMYFFARDLYQRTGVPVGIICSALGGSQIAPWIGQAAYEAAGDDVMVLLSQANPDAAATETLRKKWQEQFELWEASLAADYAGEIAAAADWMQPGIDTTAWMEARVPTTLDGLGVRENGVVWFRKTVNVPDAWAGKNLVLSLGVIDDCDDTYWNGKLVGQTTCRVPEYWKARRVYTIPAADVRPGDNVLAVRLIDHAYGGSISGSAETIRIYPEGEPEAALDLTGTQWLARTEFLIDWTRTAPRPTPFVFSDDGRSRAASLYNSMIAPLQTLPLRGILWYQGESNIGERSTEMYARRFRLLIESWRAGWGEPELPFIFAQIAPLWRQSPGEPLPEGFLESLPPQESNRASLCEAQTYVLRLPNTAMVVTLDVGDPIDIHPANKQDVGHRMALEALRLAYGEAIVSSGPLYRSMRVDGDSIVVDFDNTGSGLVAEGGPLQQFAIAGPDGVFHWAQAQIEGDTVRVRAAEVAEPVAVRYGWANYPPGANLYNAEGLPAAPFRTDRPAYLQD